MTILYRKSDLSHANAWVLNNVSNRGRCKDILSGFADSWKYINAHLAGLCRRKILLGMFNEEECCAISSGSCCDVCEAKAQNQYVLEDCRKELKILIDALDKVGCKGEVKISEWIRGSKISWTDAFDKFSISYGNHQGKGIGYWRSFIKQCHVSSLIQLELKSMIKSNGHYAVQGVYYPLPKGRKLVEDGDTLLLPSLGIHDSSSPSTAHPSDTPKCTPSSIEGKRSRLGKGSHILTLVRKFLNEPENWKEVDAKKCYQFPGVFTKTCIQQLYYIADIAPSSVRPVMMFTLCGKTFNSLRDSLIRRD